jgi:mannitol/fructose-specific phosphotransferase system IIA component (Ntr-type)
LCPALIACHPETENVEHPLFTVMQLVDEAYFKGKVKVKLSLCFFLIEHHDM